jgi:hypothetical protein
MNAIRNIAVREGHVPAAFRIQAELLSEHGRLYEITSFENERRTGQGLPPIEQRAEDVRRILVTAGVAPGNLDAERTQGETPDGGDQEEPRR